MLSVFTGFGNTKGGSNFAHSMRPRPSPRPLARVCTRVLACAGAHARTSVSEAEVARLFTLDPRAHICVGVHMRRRKKLR